MNSAKTLYSILNVIIFLLLIGIGLGIFVLAMALFGIKQDFIGLKYEALIFKTERMLYLFRAWGLCCFCPCPLEIKKGNKVVIKKRLL